MIVKALEIRDEGTTIGMFAIRTVPENSEQRAILRRAGYGTPENYVILLDAHNWEGSYDPFKQPGGGRTRKEAHLWIKEHFDELRDGDVVDVQFILGERPTKKASEIQPFYGEKV